VSANHVTRLCSTTILIDNVGNIVAGATQHPSSTNYNNKAAHYDDMSAAKDNPSLRADLYGGYTADGDGVEGIGKNV